MEMNCRNKIKKIMSEYYDVYVRSMIIYTDHELCDLQYKNVLKVNHKLATFPSYEEAESWIMKNGNAITENFVEMHDNGKDEIQYCVFNIIKTNNYDPDESCLEDELSKTDLWIIPVYPTFAFNEEAYKMILNEHLIYLSHDWAYEIPKHYAYVNGDNVKYGISKVHFRKVINLREYSEEAKEELNKQFEEYDKLSNESKRELFIKSQD